MNATVPGAVTATLLSAIERPIFLQRFTPEGEELARIWLPLLSRQYQAQPWNYYVLSNGGAYMAPHATTQFMVRVPAISLRIEASPDAAGIIASLFGLGELASLSPNPHIVDQWYSLIFFAKTHAERAGILSAIDHVQSEGRW